MLLCVCSVTILDFIQLFQKSNCSILQNIFSSDASKYVAFVVCSLHRLEMRSTDVCLGFSLCLATTMECIGKPNGKIYVVVNIFIERLGIWANILTHIVGCMHVAKIETVQLSVRTFHPVWYLWIKVRVDVEGTPIDHLYQRYSTLFSQCAYSLLHVIFHTRLQSLQPRSYASLHFNLLKHSTV